MKYVNADHPANRNRVVRHEEYTWAYGFSMPRRDLEMQRIHAQAIIRAVENHAYEKQQRKIRRANRKG